MRAVRPEGPKGVLRVESTWTILPDGGKYLSSIRLIPMGGT